MGARGEIVDDEQAIAAGEPDPFADFELDEATLAQLSRPEAGPEEPDGAQWEHGLSATDRAVWAEWSALIQVEADTPPWEPRRQCRICKLEKNIVSAGRCQACKKYAQRHPGAERPASTYLKQLERDMKRAGRL